MVESIDLASCGFLLSPLSLKNPLCGDFRNAPFCISPIVLVIWVFAFNSLNPFRISCQKGSVPLRQVKYRWKADVSTKARCKRIKSPPTHMVEAFNGQQKTKYIPSHVATSCALMGCPVSAWVMLHVASVPHPLLCLPPPQSCLRTFISACE